MFLIELETTRHRSIYVINSSIVILDDITDENQSEAIKHLHSELANTKCDVASVGKKLQSALIKTGSFYNVHNVDDYCIETDSVTTKHTRYRTVVTDSIDFELELVNTIREEVFFTSLKHIRELSFDCIDDADNYIFNYAVEQIDKALDASSFFDISENSLRILLLKNEQHWMSFQNIANALYKQKKLIKRGQK